jgi:hypothetical protein
MATTLGTAFWHRGEQAFKPATTPFVAANFATWYSFAGCGNTPPTVVRQTAGIANLEIGSLKMHRQDYMDCVLAINLAKTDREILAALSDWMSWKLVCAERLEPALRKAKSPAVRVVLCERDLPDGDWKGVFEQVRDLVHAPRFIVVSRPADERLWAEVLNLGGYDVLATPLVSEEVSRVLSYAMAPPVRHTRALTYAS